MKYSGYTWANGDIYVGDFKDYEMSGTGTKKLITGKTISGKFENGKYIE